jgi:hypothetical protein
MRYALITGLLTVAYAGLVLLAIQAFAFHTPLAVAAATLITAVLLNLPRRRLQQAVNRRFRRLA